MIILYIVSVIISLILYLATYYHDIKYYDNIFKFSIFFLLIAISLLPLINLLMYILFIVDKCRIEEKITKFIRGHNDN